MVVLFSATVAEQQVTSEEQCLLAIIIAEQQATSEEQLVDWQRVKLLVTTFIERYRRNRPVWDEIIRLLDVLENAIVDAKGIFVSAADLRAMRVFRNLADKIHALECFGDDVVAFSTVFPSFTAIFPDPNLERAIRDVINEPCGPIFKSDLIGLTHLWAGGKNISDLTGIEYLTDLTWLLLNGNLITDITPLAGLTNLTLLGLDLNLITDITSLTELINLTELSLRSNLITDITPLAGLINLTWLCLQENQISDLVPLVTNAGLSAGDRVSLKGNPLDLTPSSQNMHHIEALQARGVRVLW